MERPAKPDDAASIGRGGYRVDLVPTPDPTDPGGVRRLRWGLKTLLRRFGLRCTRCVPIRTDKHEVDKS